MAQHWTFVWRFQPAAEVLKLRVAVIAAKMPARSASKEGPQAAFPLLALRAGIGCGRVSIAQLQNC
jgi:hypothetical protein